MDDRMKEIEKKWNRLREGDADFTATDGLDDVDYLLQKVKELRARVAELEEWCGAFKDI